MSKGAQSLFELDVIQSIGQKHGKSGFGTYTHDRQRYIDTFTAPAQVLLRWATQRGIAVIPKSNNVRRLTENLKCNLFDLNDDEIAQISALNRNLRVS